ncbi:MAG: DUF4834 family protein [Nonlabens sp.]
MKFLQTLLIILIIYVIVRLIRKTFGSQIMRWMGKKAMQRVQKSFEDHMNANESAQNRETSYKKPNRGSKTNEFREKKKVGEYVDFEEID